jgi:hypothetical protein
MLLCACGAPGATTRFSLPAPTITPSAVPELPTPAPGDVGFQGPPIPGGGRPTGTKPESKLWWNDGYWWASMWSVERDGYQIFRLDAAKQAWVDTGVPIDDRRSSRADVLWDERSSKLYIASHSFTGEPRAGYPSELYRYSYDSTSRSYTLDLGFPVSINDSKLEALVIDKDSTGQLWATWVADGQVWLNASVCAPDCDDATWGTPFAVSPSSVTDDDIASVLHFGGNRTGVMWSDQNTDAYHFAIHDDADPDAAWTYETALAGPGVADDHIDLKSDSDGRVYAAVKTSLTGSTDPRIVVLVRSTNGIWADYVFGLNAEDHTRPIVVLDEQNGDMHMFATSPGGGGSIYRKTSPLDEPSFSRGLGTVVLNDADGTVSDATSTKLNVTSDTDLVVVAHSSNEAYFFSYQSL